MSSLCNMFANYYFKYTSGNDWKTMYYSSAKF